MFSKISDWRVGISNSCDLAYITFIKFDTGNKTMKYKPCRLSLILAGLIGGVVLLASSGVYADNGTSGEFQYTPVTYLDYGFDQARSTAWMGKYGQLTNENVTNEEKAIDDSLVRRSSAQETGIGMGVTPLFDTYGVFRTSSNHKQSAYLALGFISDELTMDEADTSDNRANSGFSYGFGVNNSSSNFEYMMSVDQENYEVSAIGMRFISEF
jgi:hypothetical protein